MAPLAYQYKSYWRKTANLAFASICQYVSSVGYIDSFLAAAVKWLNRAFIWRSYNLATVNGGYDVDAKRQAEGWLGLALIRIGRTSVAGRPVNRTIDQHPTTDDGYGWHRTGGVNSRVRISPDHHEPSLDVAWRKGEFLLHCFFTQCYIA